jgi:hypothetical protein
LPFEDVRLENLILTEGAFGDFIRRCPQVKYLTVDHCSAIGSHTNEPLLTNAVLVHLAMHCSAVEELSLQHCENLDGAYISNAALLLLMQQCQKMRKFRLAYTAGLTELGFAILGQSRALQTLEISSSDCLTDAGLAALVGSAPLRELILGADRDDDGLATDDGLEALATGLSASLEVFVYRNADQIGDRGLGGLAGCEGLRVVVLRCCYGVTDRGVRRLAEACGRLETLDLGGCAVSGSCLVCLGGHCAALRTVCFDGCVRVDDAALEALSAGCHHLRSVFLTGCRRVTDSGLRAISLHLPDIEHLTLRTSDYVTDTGLYYLSLRCKQLAVLDIGGDPGGITPAGVAALLENCVLLDDVYTREKKAPS